MKKKNLIILIIFLSLFILVDASPPTVNFTYSPLSPIANESITFTPSITSTYDLNSLYWMFDIDGNTNYNRTYIPGLLFSDNFIDTNGTDLNTHNINWSTKGTGAGWFAKIVSNNAMIRANPASQTDVNLMNNDINLAFQDQNIVLQFRYIGVQNNISQINNKLMNSIDGNNAINIRFIAPLATPAINYQVNGTDNLIGNATSGDYFKVIIKRKSNPNIFDINFFKNGVNVLNVADQNFNFSSFRFKIENASSGLSDYNIADFNIIGTGGGSFVPTSPISLTNPENHSFSSGGSKNVCLTAGNTDGNTTFCDSLNISGSLQFLVKDENTNLTIPNPSIIFNGTRYDGNSGGSIVIPIPTVSDDYLIEAFATNYPSRNFLYNLDVNSVISDTIYLLDSTKGRNISFLIRDVNSTKYPNSVFRIQKNGIVVSKILTNNQAITNEIYLTNYPSDYNYFIDSNSTNENIFDYNNTTLTIKKPFNETTTEIVSPFGLNITDNGNIDINNLSNDVITKIYPNTYHPYGITLDANNLSYFERYYHIRSLGGEETKSIQPVMLRGQDNALPANMQITNNITFQNISNYLVEFKTDINGLSNQLAESPQTDTTGNFLFTTITGKRYNIYVYDEEGDLFKQGQFIASTSSNYYMDIFTGIIQDVNITNGIVDLNILLPTSDSIFLNDNNNFGFRFKINSTGPTVSGITISVDTISQNIYSTSYLPTFPSTTFTNGQSFDTNFSTSLNYTPITITATLLTNNGTITKKYHYFLNQSNNSVNVFPGLNGLIQNLGGFGGGLLWLMISIILVIGLRFNPVVGIDNGSMVWVIILWTGIAGFMGIINFVIAIIGIMAGISYWGLRNRPLG